MTQQWRALDALALELNSATSIRMVAHNYLYPSSRESNAVFLPL